MTAKLQLRTAIGTRALCAQLALSYSTLRRWRARSRQNQPLLKRPGPKKLGPLPFEEVRREVEELLHAQKRTRGSGALYRRHREAISRRDLGQWIGEHRIAVARAQRNNHQRIRWNKPNLAWAIDATEYGRDQSGRKLYLIVVIDLASRYVFPPLVTLNPIGDEVVRYLRELFRRNGCPLLLKRDNGSIFNYQPLDALLAEQGVIPLNSPAYYPRYNGGIEKGICDFKTSLHGCLPQVPAHWELPAIGHFANAAAHLRNCAKRRCLGRLTAAQTYLGLPAARFTKAHRHATFLWIKRRAAAILASCRLPNRHDARAAWRAATQHWLQSHNLITVHVNPTIHINQPVLPNFHFALLS